MLNIKSEIMKKKMLSCLTVILENFKWYFITSVPKLEAWRDKKEELERQV